MALSSTVYHLQVSLSDVDRNVYEELDLRLARHPSESMHHLLTRVLAYCLCYQEGIAFSKGLSTSEEPAVWARDLRGDLQLWIDVGTPSAERLHKASKASPRVVVFTYQDPSLLSKTIRGKTIFRGDEIEVYPVNPEFLHQLAAATDRNTSWLLVRTEGIVYVTIGETNASTVIARFPLLSEG
ncbi:MAG TPA: YaeQ family protein [Polyangia bacterium]|jgi:uncharacterized protein YaeQ